MKSRPEAVKGSCHGGRQFDEAASLDFLFSEVSGLQLDEHCKLAHFAPILFFLFTLKTWQLEILKVSEFVLFLCFVLSQIVMRLSQ